MKKKQLKKKQIWVPENLVKIAQDYADKHGLRLEYAYGKIFENGLIKMSLIKEEGVIFG